MRQHIDEEVANAREAAAALIEFATLLEKRGKWTRSVAEAEVAAMRAVDAIWPDWLEGAIAERVAEFELEPTDADGFELDPDTAYSVMMPDGSHEWKGERL